MTVNTEILLDKLYNLRGSDSDILKEMDRQKNKAEQNSALFFLLKLFYHQIKFCFINQCFPYKPLVFFRFVPHTQT